VVLGVVLALVLSGGGAKVEVPNLEGMSEEQARQTLEDLGLALGEVEDQYVEDASQKVGVVVSQDPEWGTLLAKGEKVNITVTREMKMPKVTGMDKDEAEEVLRKLGVKVIEIANQEVEDEDDIGIVLSQDPVGGKYISPKTSVRLVVGVEQTKVTVPNVVGLGRDEAERRLRDAGFQVAVSEEASSEVAEGKVIRQSPLANLKVAKGSQVTIVVSKGPAMVEVPSVIDETADDAKDILEDAGLHAVEHTQVVVDPTKVGKVVSQNPAAGTMVESGSNVHIYVGTL
jgi:serine/threonine-protein kinase